MAGHGRLPDDLHRRGVQHDDDHEQGRGGHDVVAADQHRVPEARQARALRLGHHHPATASRAPATGTSSSRTSTATRRSRRARSCASTSPASSCRCAPGRPPAPRATPRLTNWVQLANSITNGSAASGSADQPFTTPAALASASTSFQRLTINLVAAAGTARRHDHRPKHQTFTALNSVASATTNSTKCQQLGSGGGHDRQADARDVAAAPGCRTATTTPVRWRWR